MSDVATDAPSRRHRPGAATVLGVVAAVAAVALAGLVGLAVVVAVAAVRLSRAPAALLAGAGVTLLVAAPLAVVANGLPSRAQVSPGIVSETLVPHHLVFAGLALVGVWVVLDVAPDRVRRPRPEPDGPDADPRTPRWMRLGAFAAAAAVAVASSVLVLGA